MKTLAACASLFPVIFATLLHAQERDSSPCTRYEILPFQSASPSDSQTVRLAQDLVAEAITLQSGSVALDADTQKRVAEQVLQQSGVTEPGITHNTTSEIIPQGATCRVGATIKRRRSLLGLLPDRFQWDMERQVITGNDTVIINWIKQGALEQFDHTAEQTALQVLGWTSQDLDRLDDTRYFRRKELGFRIGQGWSYRRASENAEQPDHQFATSTVTDRGLAGTGIEFFGRRRFTEFAIGGIVAGPVSDLHFRIDLFLLDPLAIRLSHRSLTMEINQNGQERASMETDLLGAGLVFRRPGLRGWAEFGIPYHAEAGMHPAGYRESRVLLHGTGNTAWFGAGAEIDLSKTLSLQVQYSRIGLSQDSVAFHYQGLPTRYWRAQDWASHTVEFSLGYRLPY